MLAILVLALGLTLCSAKLSKTSTVEPMGTAFTYQGRLIDGNGPAEGQYDFQFKLFDDLNAGAQKGITIDIYDIEIVDGYFTVELDFENDPNVFNGAARWLEIGVQAGGAGGFTTLNPRQKVTPTPYALLAADVKAPLSVGGYSLDPIILGINAYNEGIGVCGVAFGSDGQGVRGKNVVSENAGSLGGEDYGVKSEGDLVVDGNDAAFRGTIGPNNGAPFPRPAYDSGWVAGSGGFVTLFHNIGGNVNNYVVDTQSKVPGRGIMTYTGPYENLTTNSVMIYGSSPESFCRLRIWVYN